MSQVAVNPFLDYFAQSCAGIVPSLWSHARSHVEELLSARNNWARLQRYAKRCPVAGVDPTKYAPVCLTLPSGAFVIATIHFRALNTDFPFVDVSAQTAPIDIEQDVQIIAAAFAPFSPIALRLWLPAKDELSGDLEPDMFVVGAPLSRLSQPMAYVNQERVSLVPASRSAYPAYRAAYAAVHLSTPWRIGHVEPVGQPIIADCARLGTFYRVLVDGAAAGFIAARPSTFRCWRGWEIVDEVLLPQYHGRGFAKAMQSRFVTKLDPRRQPGLYGTIWAHNVASLKTACGVGRQIVERSGLIKLR